MVSIGISYTCGIRNGELYCWGKNDTGQIGDGTYYSRTAPARIGTESDWTWVSASDSDTCGIRSGKLFCWGKNERGLMDAGAASVMKTPIQIGNENDWSAISRMRLFACGIRNGNLYCWGLNISGQLGNGTNGYGTDTYTPEKIGEFSNWSAVSAGAGHSCGIRNGEFYCWGSNSDGQLGNGKAWELTPVEVVEP
jgi:alpha-tubulin suppressor-like RCC1 family protein